MGCAEMQVCLFPDSQDSAIHSAKHSYFLILKRLNKSPKLSDTVSVYTKGLRFSVAQESRFQAAKLSNMGNAFLQFVRKLLLRNRVLGCETLR